MQAFRSLSEALRQGFEVYDKTANGYIVRKRMNSQWALALVELIRPHELPISVGDPDC